MSSQFISKVSEWEEIQNNLRPNIIVHDCGHFVDDPKYLPRLIAGIDISYFDDDTSRAYVALVVMQFNNSKMSTVYSHASFIPNITVPYIPSYLAFREIEHYVNEFKLLKENHPEFLPEVLLVDGNGMLHPRQFG